MNADNAPLKGLGMSDNTTREPVLDERALDEACKIDPMLVIESSTSLQDARRMLVAAHVTAYLAALPPARPAEPTSEPLTAHERYALDLCDQYLSLLAAQDVGPEDTVITDALTNRHLELIYNLARRASAPLPSGEPTSEAVAWHEAIRPYANAFPEWDNLTPFQQDIIRSFARLYAHPLPSDAPSGDGATRSDFYNQGFRDGLSAGRSASPPQDAPRLAEVATDKQFSGTWNNWIAPFHRCASCGDSLNWQQSVDVFDRPLITASCACGVMYSARLGEEGLEQARAVDAGNKLAALCVAPAAPVDLSAVEAAIEEFEWATGQVDLFPQPFETEEARKAFEGKVAAKEACRAALLSLYRTALSGVTAKEPASETSENIARNYVPERESLPCGDEVDVLTFRDRVALVEAGRAMRDDFDTDVLRALCGEAAQCTAKVDSDAARELTVRLNQAWRGEDPCGVTAKEAGETKADTRVQTALELARSYGSIDGAHHKMWLIDQMVRALLPNDGEYEAWVVAQKAGEDGPDTYEWDEGIAP